MFKISRGCYQEMIQDAQRRLPNEACGILAGRDETAAQFYSIENTEQSPVVYAMDMKAVLKLTKEMRTRGERMLGIYHSHVATQAYPSAKDISLAFYPEVHYVIISLVDRTRPAARAFRIEDGRIREDSIEVIS